MAYSAITVTQVTFDKFGQDYRSFNIWGNVTDLAGPWQNNLPDRRRSLLPQNPYMV
jgi:hypothetical protein